MGEGTSFSRRSFWETNADECYTCSKKFRSGDRRRHLELNVTVCAACHQSHVRFLSLNSNLNGNSVMDMDLPNAHVVFDVATQTDFDFSGQEALIPVTTTSSSIIKNGSVAMEFDVDTIRLPFFRISKSNNRCPVCSKYFVDSNYSATTICDSIRATTLINHHIFIPEKSRCCSTHLDPTNFKLPTVDLIKKGYDKTCLIKMNELMQVLESLKAE